MEAEELEQNLRRFAMRQASAASKEFSDLKSRVVVSVCNQAHLDIVQCMVDMATFRCSLNSLSQAVIVPVVAARRWLES